ncbi:hypothetical protein HRbin25_00989 [bacterium HR25]|nr:hypothetical protein HRbin25_00989 [bacterium HR25]
MTMGVSVIPAADIASCIREKPGPAVAVMERAPATAAPMTWWAAAISLSAWRTAPPKRGSFSAMYSRTSEAGVMG